MDWQNPNETMLEEGWCLLLTNDGVVVGGWLALDSITEANLQIETVSLYYGPAAHDRDLFGMNEIVGWCPVKGPQPAWKEPCDWAVGRQFHTSKWRRK